MRWEKHAGGRHGRFYLAGEVEIIGEVAPIAGEVVLRKTAPSCFFGTPLAALLIREGVDTLIVVGESTSGCVRATVVDGKAYRFKILVPEECVFDRHEAPHAINLFDLDQKYAKVLPVGEVLHYLARIGAGIAAVGADTYESGARCMGSVLLDRMKVAGS